MKITTKQQRLVQVTRQQVPQKAVRLQRVQKQNQIRLNNNK